MEEYIVVKPTDGNYINEIYKILFLCGLNMAKQFLFHWIKPYSKAAIKKDCETKTVIIVKDKSTGIYTSTFQMYVNDDGNLYVRKIATRPDHEGKGIGKRNMQYMVAYAKDKGCSKVCLDVYKKSPRAVGFYKKFGFVVTGETTSRFFSEYIMEKTVK